jgi:hypothetical protein
MSDNNIKTQIEQRASALADAYIAEDLDKVMSHFSEDIEFSDIGTHAANSATGPPFPAILTTLSHVGLRPQPRLPPRLLFEDVL